MSRGASWLLGRLFVVLAAIRNSPQTSNSTSNQAFHTLQVLPIKKMIVCSPFGFFSAIHVEQHVKLWTGCELRPGPVVTITDTCLKPSHVHVFPAVSQIKSGFCSFLWNDCDCFSSDTLLVRPPQSDTSFRFVLSDYKIPQDLLLFYHPHSILGSLAVSLHFCRGLVAGCH